MTTDPTKLADILSRLWLATLPIVLPQDLDEEIAQALLAAGYDDMHRPLTHSEAEAAFDAAEAIPLSEERIQAIVDYVVGKTPGRASGRSAAGGEEK